MFLSEWREFPSAPCLAEKKTLWQLASRYCWNQARPWHASELVSFLVGLRTYQHTGINVYWSTKVIMEVPRHADLGGWDFSFLGLTATSKPGPTHYRSFTITPRHTTFGSTPLDEWSARLRDPPAWQHTTLTRDRLQCPPRDSNPQYKQASSCRPAPSTVPTLGSARLKYSSTNFSP